MVNETQGQLTQLSIEPGPSLAAIPTPAPTSEDVAPLVMASNEVQTAQARLAAQPSPTIKQDGYTVVVKAPPAGGMLAYLVGPGAQIQLEGIDLNKSTVSQEGGNLRITTAGGSEVLLLDYVNSAKDPSTVVITDSGKLPAQQLLAALDAAEIAQKVADVEPAAGPGAGGEGGGLLPPTILGTGVGSGEGIFSSVIGPFALPVPYDTIKTEPFLEGNAPYNDVVAVDDVVDMAKDVNSILIDAKANDYDPQGDSFRITRIVSVSEGSATIENGQIRYNNPTRDAGTATIVYEITDSKGATDTATITVNIAADTNDVVAVDDVVPMAKDVNSILIDAKANDYDPQGDAFSITRIVSVSEGTAVIENGQIRYDNPTRDAGTATIVYEITDSRGATSTATITVNIAADTNDVVAVDDVVTMAKDVNSILIDAKANDYDPQQDTFDITRIVSVDGGGTATIENGQIRYTNPTQLSGTATIVYEITDSRGATDTATIVVNIEADTVVAPNKPPLALDDSFSTSVNTPITMTPGQLLANDSDPDGDPIHIISVGSPQNGTVQIVNGNVVFTPTPGFQGTGSYSYTISDGKGGTSSADVIIQIDPDPSNENNVIAADDASSVVAGRSVTVDVLANDSDPESGRGDYLVPGSVRIVQGPSVGTATVNPDGTISYQSVGRDAYFVTIVYEVSDNLGARDTATLTIEVLPAANTVIAVDDTGEIVPAGATKTFDVTNNDLDPQGDSFKITSIKQPTVGRAEFDAATGTITYESVASNEPYNVVIEYTITDDRGATDTASLTIRVEPSNNVSAVDDTADVMAGQTVRIDVLANDYDAQDDSFSIVPGSWTQPMVRDGSGFGDARGSVILNADGTLSYVDTPGARTSAVVEFTYQIVDEHGAVDTAVVRVTIGPAVNGVDANNDTLSVEQDSARADITSTLLANDFDPQNDTFKITSITQPSVGLGTVTLDANGHVFFTPADGYVGPVNFTYTITDALGATDTAQVYINVQAKPPVDDTSVIAGNDNFSTPFNTNLTITPAQLLANDYDPEGTTLNASNILSFTQPANGTITRDASGNFIYNPNDTFRGTDTFTYTIRDAQGDEATATVVIRVDEPAPLDNPVDAVDDTMTLAPTETRIINVLANDSAPDGGLAFVRVVGTLPAGVTDLGGGVFSYTAPAGSGGQTITFQYEARDVDGDTDIATVTIVVKDNSVVAVDDVVTMAKDVNSILIDAKANDYDPQNDTFSITRIVSVSSGTATIEDGQIRYNNPTRAAGTATIVYEVTDSKGATDTATITVKIEADSNSVVAVDDHVTMQSNVNSMLINAIANDYDPQGDAFSITRIVSVSSGTATIESGQIRYVNGTRDAGSATIVYEITDALGAKSQATVHVTIQADTNNVVAVNDYVTMGQDVNSMLINAKANDYDPQGDAFAITRIVSVSSGSASIESGQIRYVNGTRDAGSATIVYEITDALGAKSQATVYVTIQADSNNVVAVNDSASVANRSSVNINVLSNDYDPQGDAFTVSRIVSGPSRGSARVESNGTITYVAASTALAYTTTFVYEIVDSRGATSQATVTVKVASSISSGGGRDGGDGGSGGGDCPLVIDLNGDGISIAMKSQSTAHFDLNGDGFAEWTSWVNGSDDAILAIDRNGNGTIDGIDEVFGGPGVDGFTELARLEDSNGDGVIDANDANWSQLRLWLDANGDGISQENELFTLDHFGIVAINLTSTGTSIQYGDAYIDKVGTVVKEDGSTLNAGSVFYTNNSNGQLKGTSGDDVLIYSSAADTIDGGQGADTLKVLAASDIVISHDNVHSVEHIDLANNGADKLTLNINDVLGMSDNGILTIKGDAVDEITLNGDLTRGDNVSQGGQSYASYVAANGGTVLVELGLTVHTQEQQH